MKKVSFILLISIVSITTLTGCWDRRELNDLAIVIGLGIDKNEDEGYTVSVQVLNPSEIASQATGGGSGYDTPVTTYTTTGKILFEALRKLTQQVPRKIYLSHLEMIVIGEGIAKEDIYNFLDFLSRDHSVRTDFYMVVSKDCKAEDVLKVLTSIDKIPADMLFESLESSSEAWAATSKVKLDDLLNDIVSEGTQPVLTAVKIMGDPEAGTNLDNVQNTDPKTRLYFDGMAAFKNNKLVGWLNEDQSKGLNYVKGKVQSTIIVIDINNAQIGVELLKSTAEIIPHIDGTKPPSIEVKIFGEANVAEVNTKLDLMSADVFSELEKKTNGDIKDKIIKAVDKAQKEYESDIFGFGNHIYKKDPKMWGKIKKNWMEMYPEIQVHVSVDIKLRRVGTITNPIHNELLEE